MKSTETGVFATRIIFIILLAAHLIINTYYLIQDLRSCAREFYEDEGKDVPLSNIMISQIPLIEFKKQNPIQANSTNDKDL